MANEIPVVFHNGSNYDFHFIIKELANETEEKFEYSGRNTKMCKNFFVPVEKEVRKIDKDGNVNVVTISYKIKFIESTRFMATSLSNLVDNLHKEFKNLNVKIVIVFLNTKVTKKSIKYKCTSCNKDYSNVIDEELRKRFKNTFQYSNSDIKKFILLLRKGVYPYEYMNDWEKFNEITLP